MCKKFFYTFLHFLIFDLNDKSRNKIEPIEPIEPSEPKLDLSNNKKISFYLLKYDKNSIYRQI